MFFYFKFHNSINKVFDYKKYILPGDLIKIFDLIRSCVIEKAKKEKAQLSILEISQILTIVFWNNPFQDKICCNIWRKVNNENLLNNNDNELNPNP
jgi:hypothetical protein